MNKRDLYIYEKMQSLNLNYLVGEPVKQVKAYQIFDEDVCGFLDDLSKEIRKNERSKAFPDVLSFAFYCRKGNISIIKKKYEEELFRIGRGLAFHIAPSNIPVNFAFSLLFGLVGGCMNIIRVSQKKYEQTAIICTAINKLFQMEKYGSVKDRIIIVEYVKEKIINDTLSDICDVRIIWGGDDTISQLRTSPMGSKCQEIVFADRYSFGIINGQAICEASDHDIASLAEKFYNDTYYMDQNACSTPHMIFWIEGNKKAKERFWKAVYEKAKKYDLSDIKTSEKYGMLSEYAIKLENIQISQYDNLLYVISVLQAPEEISLLRGRFGLFFQYDISYISEIAPYVDNKTQSCLYYGIDPDEIKAVICKYGLTGIDRIVKFGESLDIGMIWDGYDLPLMLSRAVTIK